MHQLPPVAVTASTEIIRGALRLRVNAAYTDAIRGAGLLPLVLPVLDPADAAAALDGVAGLVLTGGEDVNPARYGTAPHPRLGEVHDGRDAFETALVAAARERSLPTLAICRGVQILDVALGGTLLQDIPSERPDAIVHNGQWPRTARVHEVDVVAESRLARALGTERPVVNSMHHQAIATVPPSLATVARAPDGIVEGVEWPTDDWWLVGVQWHPEELTGSPEPWDRALLAAFADVVARGARVS
ncbi:MAG TPA: gamma-glutamyl-gamma-aminobutyrate hydrolase family protein [Gemmatimonadaceae bacterium]|jgi:putative glutamine amidotransferase|nr:gamma-glutamyl-gamma-aminobutyrate hydrolase family protein [Gemmatimonadaceae bacterium]